MSDLGRPPLPKLLDWGLVVFERLPSTNVRIAASIWLALATGVVVLVRWTAPPWEWLTFLALMMGLDVAQFGMKRLTHKNGAAASPTTAERASGALVPPPGTVQP